MGDRGSGLMLANNIIAGLPGAGPRTGQIT